MGDKITVDSAGLINKALEIMEAHYLFKVPYEKIEAVIHHKASFMQPCRQRTDRFAYTCRHPT